ncbi:MAG: LacI family DNA-binding transcriptional regulator [Anaerolineales bacterium]|nr:LacI family DNA-binding transcriptional regulator [Anaerolineales bacterium]
MANIKDVAQAAGVSTATVSRVLANHVSIRVETRQRVLEAIARLNYRPNLIARSLRAQKSARIGLVVSDIRNPFFTAIGRAVEDAAYEQGYSVLMCNTDENPEKEELYLNVLHDENVAGVIFSPTQQFGASFHQSNSKIPMVIIDRQMETDKADLVLLDNVLAAHELTTHLIQNGFRRIAGLFGDASATGRDRHAGFLQALGEHALQDAGVHFISPRIQSGYDAALRLLERKNRPDAILTSNSLLTAGVFQALRDKKVKVPDEVGLAGFDETTWGQLVDPPITVIAQPTEEIGRTATELLFQRIQNPDRPAHRVILKGRLMEGLSSVKAKSPLHPAAD